MPIYEYRCPKCGEFEQVQRITDPPLQRCPTCRKKVTKLISNTSFQLKGGGWYITDYANKGSAKKEAEKGDSGEKKEAKSEKSDKKDSAAKNSSTSKASAAA